MFAKSFLKRLVTLDGITIQVCIGKWAKPHLFRGEYLFRLCLGFVALTIVLTDEGYANYLMGLRWAKTISPAETKHILAALRLEDVKLTQQSATGRLNGVYHPEQSAHGWEEEG